MNSKEKKRPDTIAELLAQLREEQVPETLYKSEINKFLDFKARDQGIPLSGQFELTPLCNLDCKMCYVHLQKEQMKEKQLLPVEKWKELILQAIEAGMMHAELTGGECLMYPGFEELYLFLHQYGIEVSVKTNGVLLNQQRIAFFQKNPPSLIQVTLYGSDEDGYERVTGQRLFHVVKENMLAAKEAGLPVAISITPNIFMKDARETIQLVHELGFPFIVNSGLFTPNADTGRSEDVIDIDWKEYIELMKYQRELQGREVVPESSRSIPDIQMGGDTKAYGIRCAAGRSHFDIDWRGTMTGCGNLPELSANPWEEGFAKAWKIINEKAENYPRAMECEGCNYYDYCIHCQAMVQQGASKGHVNPRICERARLMLQEGIISWKDIQVERL